MKFLCDRCKARYSIGDDRVRGKILKIRCKTCMNVITVREGMSADPDGLRPATPEFAGRAKRSTTMAPDTHEAPSEGRGELAASAPHETPTTGPNGPNGPNVRDARGTAPPPRTANATAFRDPVAKPAPGKPAGGRLAAASPPPDMAATRGQARTAGAADGRAKRAGGESPREEPTALGAAFATAMAKPPPALEEEWYVAIDGDQAGPFSLVEAQGWVAQKPVDADLHCWSEGFDDWLPIDKVSHFRGLRQHALSPPAARLSQGAPRAQLSGSSVAAPGDPARPLFTATMASIERGPAGPGASTPPPPPRATPPFGVLAQPRAGGTQSERSLARPGDTRPPANFDTSEDSDPDGELEATRYRGLSTVGKPSLMGAVVTDAASDFESAAHVSGDDLDIGEVSRVVKLADLAPRPRAERPGSSHRAATHPAAIGRPPTHAGYHHASPGLGAVNGPAAGLPVGYIHSGAEPDASAIAPVVKAHRRGLIALLSVALVMVAGVIGAVLLLVNTSDDPTGGGLGPLHNIDTSRPEDPITHRPIEPPPAPPVAPVAPRPIVKRSGSAAAAREPDPAPGGSLRSDEIEDMARKHTDMTQRCYMRSQRGADSITVGEVKKIGITLTVDRDGNVNDLQLSEHAGDTLGKCLTGSIKGWKFRPSAGGTFRFSLNFAPG